MFGDWLANIPRWSLIIAEYSPSTSRNKTSPMVREKFQSKHWKFWASGKCSPTSTTSSDYSPKVRLYLPNISWVDQGSVEHEVCPTLLHMTSTGIRTLDLLILSPTPYPLGHMLPKCHSHLYHSHVYLSLFHDRRPLWGLLVFPNGIVVSFPHLNNSI